DSSDNNDSGPIKTTASSPETITVVSSDVRVRTGPGTTYSIAGYTTKDHTYTLLETSNNWHKIAFDNGKTGWIASWLTNKSTQPATNNTMKDDQQGSTETTQSGSLSGYTIVLDPGHGGRDPGSIALDGTFEKE